MIFNLRSSLIFFMLLIPTLFLSACQKLKINSQRVNQPIKIDGDQSEWGDVLCYQDKENLSIGFMNDDTCLYACLITTDQDLKRRMLMSGFVVWFNPAGEKAERFGVKYPIGMRRPNGPPDGQQGQQFQRDENQMGNRPMNDRNLPGNRQEALIKNLPQDVQIINPDGEIEQFNLNNLDDMKICLGENSAGLAYEIKIPYGPETGALYSIMTAQRNEIEVGFEIPEMKRPTRDDGPGQGPGGMPPDGGDDMRGGGMGQGRGMRGGPGGPSGGMDNVKTSEQLKKWVTVILAK